VKDLLRFTRMAEQAGVFSSNAEQARKRNAKYTEELQELVSDAKKKESDSCLSNFVYTRVSPIKCLSLNVLLHLTHSLINLKNNYWGLVKTTYPYWQKS
jgi:hypothetical protein